MSDLVSRIEKLSQGKRTLLLNRLEGTSPKGVSHHQSLIAYVVPESEQVSSSGGESASTEYLNRLRAYAEEHLPGQMVPSRFILIDALPLTPSGKVDRGALPPPDSIGPTLGDSLVLPRNQVEESLAGIWASVLGLESVGVYDDFFELGGDSIISIQIVSRARQAGLTLAPGQLTENPTIAALASMIGTDKPVQAEQGPVSGTVPLSPIQHWFFEQQFVESQHWNQWMILELSSPLEYSLLEQAAQQLGHHHDALRLRFTPTSTGSQQSHADPVAEVPVTKVDLSGVEEGHRETILLETVERMQSRLNLSEGPLISLAHFGMGEGRPDRILILIHHLAVDSTSWHILLEDLNTACKQLRRGEIVQLPPKTSSFKSWSEQLSKHAQSPTVRRELGFWLGQAGSETPALQVDEATDENTIASSHSVIVSLSPEETQSLLHQVPSAYNTQINDALLTALVLALSQFDGPTSIKVGLEGHGREQIVEDIDLSRTVGWFTSFFPVTLRIENISDLGEALKSIKEQLRRIPSRGIGYGLLRYLSQNQEISEKLSALSEPEVLFNYVGRFDQPSVEDSIFHLSTFPSASRNPKQHRSHLLEVNAAIFELRLTLRWTYSSRIHRRETVEHIANAYIDALQRIIVHCLHPESAGYTPSDFPEAGLSQADLDSLIDGVS